MRTFASRRARGIVLAAGAAVAATALSAASCSYGNYDGSYDGGGPESGAEAGTRVLSQAIDPSKDQKLTTPDGVVQITIPKGAFPAPITVTVDRLADRVVDGYLVPVYAIGGADAPAALPIQIVLSGNMNSGGSVQLRTLVVARQQDDGTFAPAAFGGGPNRSGTVAVWTLTKRFGVFSLVWIGLADAKPFADITPSSCLAKCCQTGGNGTNANAAAVGGACFCQAEPSFDCFLSACPNLGDVVTRCSELGNTPTGLVTCDHSGSTGNCSGGPCGYPGTCNETATMNSGGPNTGVCCIHKTNGQCQSSLCAGIAVRCDPSTKCPDGTTCCVFDDDAYCTASCPTGRTWCKMQSDCDGGVGEAGPGGADGGPCQAAPGCPAGTCGAPPPSCVP